MDLKDGIYMVVGGGRSGVSTAKFLSGKNKKVYLTDTKEYEDIVPLGFGIDTIKNDKNITFILGRQPKEEEIKECEMMIVSPSVPPKAFPIVTAKKNDIPVYSEFEFANSFCKGYEIAITGTNGKTTTTTLVGDIFENAGYDTYVNGNIGNSFINDAVKGDENSVYALEVSSYQLELTDKFKPDIAIMTNITPDHLERHGTFEEYVRVKGNVFVNQDENDYLIINKEDEILMDLSKNAKSKVLTFTVKEDENANAYLKDENIIINFKGEVYPLININELKLYGLHNVMNVMAASLAAAVKGVKKENLVNTLKNFKSVEHRIEYVDTVEGIEYINDSKGTNVDATVTAMKAMKKKTVLMLGGYDKMTPFDELAKSINDNIKCIVLYGVVQNKIKDTLDKYDYKNYHMVEGGFDEVCKKATEFADKGECVLLSPATSSFDMFDDYEQRGRAFKSYVKNLKG